MALRHAARRVVEVQYGVVDGSSDAADPHEGHERDTEREDRDAERGSLHGYVIVIGPVMRSVSEPLITPSTSPLIGNDRTKALKVQLIVGLMNVIR